MKIKGNKRYFNLNFLLLLCDKIHINLDIQVFLFAWRMSFNILTGKSTEFHQFLFLESIFISLPLLKHSFTRYIILVLLKKQQQQKNTYVAVTDKNPTTVLIFTSLGKVLFSSGFFHNILWILFQFEYSIPMGSILFCFYSAVIWASWIHGLVYITNFERSWLPQIFLLFQFLFLFFGILTICK